MLKQILQEVLKLNEATDIEKADFNCFYIEDYDFQVSDTDELFKSNTTEVVLITDKNFHKEDAETFKIDTENLITYLEDTIDRYDFIGSEKVLDFTGGYSLDRFLGDYIEDTFKKKWCKKYEELENYVNAKPLDGNAKKPGSKIKESVLRESVDYSKMTINQIARIIKSDWKNIYFGAKPYLDAMYSLESISDRYGMDSGDSIVAYFLGNAMSWRGEVAKAVKAELNKRLKSAR